LGSGPSSPGVGSIFFCCARFCSGVGSWITVLVLVILVLIPEFQSFLVRLSGGSGFWFLGPGMDAGS